METLKRNIFKKIFIVLLLAIGVLYIHMSLKNPCLFAPCPYALMEYINKHPELFKLN